MKICIVGGIFGKPADYQAKHCLAPETLLAKGLEEKGYQVNRVDHNSFRPSDDYDIVHVHHLAKGAIRAAIAETNSKFVFTTHNGQMLCGYEKSWTRKKAFWFCVKRADAMVALSKSEQAFYARKQAAIAARTTIIHNGLPEGVFNPPEREKAPAQLPQSILFVGQLIPLKGLDILFEAFKTVASDRELRLKLAYQTDEYEEHYKKLVEKLGIQNKVEFIGFISPDQLRVLYQDASLFVLPSYAESFPTTILEAMLCGTPIVATDVGGVAEQVGDSGILVSPGNVEELTHAIERVLDDLDRYKRLSIQASESIAARFSLQKMIEQHEGLYQKVLKEKAMKPTAMDLLVNSAARQAMKVMS